MCSFCLHIQNLHIMKSVVAEAIKTYNKQRPHYSNYMLTPDQMPAQNRIKMRTYKTKNSSKPELTTV